MLPRLLYLYLSSAAALVSAASDDDEPSITTSPQAKVPSWLSDQAMEMTLTISNKTGRKTLDDRFEILPLTAFTGLNQSTDAQSMVQIRGNLIAANETNFNALNHPSDIAYLSCDGTTNGYIDHNKMLNDLMKQRPDAILLYTTSGSWCSLSDPDPATFGTIVSMARADQASKVLGYLNGTNGSILVTGSILEAINTTTSNPTQSPAVATSLLYGITGFITLLFVCIIVTGALRAHRNPQRYGPRPGVNGRSRQSRARGLARAMLETIPIVKFGDNAGENKPDPAIELENGTNSREGAEQNSASDTREAGRSETPNDEDPDRVAPVPSGKENAASAAPKETGEKYTECSICTENFTVGEDVRVLPCNHQFHPACIDPWLVQVSGTCPLCRLDLRVGHEAENENAENTADAENPDALPPPIPLENGEETVTVASVRNDRLAQLIQQEGMDIYGVRGDSPAQQLAALRRLSTASQLAAANREQQRGTSRFADRLRDRFRIRTRAQPSEPASQPSEQTSQPSEETGGTETTTQEPPRQSRLSLMRGMHSGGRGM